MSTGFDSKSAANRDINLELVRAGWEVTELPNGNISVLTGGVDSPARSNDWIKANILGGNSAQLRTWETLLYNVVDRSGGARRISIIVHTTQRNKTVFKGRCDNDDFENLTFTSDGRFPLRWRRQPFVENGRRRVHRPPNAAPGYDRQVRISPEGQVRN